MKQQEITIQGKTYPVRFDLQTILNFEEINGGTSIFADRLTTFKSRLAIVMAAVLSANPDTDLTVESLMGGKDWQAAQDILKAYTTVDALASEFFGIPDIEKQNEPAAPADATEEEQPKN